MLKEKGVQMQVYIMVKNNRWAKCISVCKTNSLQYLGKSGTANGLDTYDSIKHPLN